MCYNTYAIFWQSAPGQNLDILPYKSLFLYVFCIFLLLFPRKIKVKKFHVLLYLSPILAINPWPKPWHFTIQKYHFIRFLYFFLFYFPANKSKKVPCVIIPKPYFGNQPLAKTLTFHHIKVSFHTFFVLFYVLIIKT